MFMKKNSTVNENENVVNLSALEICMSDYCREEELVTGQNLTNDHIYKIFRCFYFKSVVSFDSVQDFIRKYLKTGEKISFATLNLFSPTNIKDVRDCTLKKLRDFIEKYVEQNENYSNNMDSKIKENEIVTFDNLDQNISNDLTQFKLSDKNKEELEFLGHLFEYVKNDKELSDEKNKEHIKYFTDWQEKLLNDTVSKIMDENCKDINCLAAGLLKFKYETKQYAGLKDLQNGILQYVESIVFYYGQSDRGDGALRSYFFELEKLFNEDTRKKIFDHEFVQELKNVILGKDKKITKWYQIEFLRNVLDIDSKVNNKSYSFDEAYDFIFEGQDDITIQEIVRYVLVNEPLLVNGSPKFDKTNVWFYDFFIRNFLEYNTDQNLNIDSKKFKTFCQMFYLQSEAIRNYAVSESTNDIDKNQLSKSLETPTKNYLSSEYCLSEGNTVLSGYKNLEVKRLYWRRFYLTFPENYNGYKITDKFICQTDKKIRVRIKNSLMYEQNTRRYEIFIGTVFLVLGFVSLTILKSAADILSLPIKLIINAFCSAIIAFKREEYFWMIILPIKELFLGVLFAIFSPIIYLCNNFCGSKHLFHISGSGKKLVTFSNWNFYNSEKKVYDFNNLRNFNLTDINLWFFIKYIFGFGCVVKLKKSENLDLIAELKLTENNKKVDDKNSNVKVCNKTLWSYCPSIKYTNEYSPLRYIERS